MKKSKRIGHMLGDTDMGIDFCRFCFDLNTVGVGTGLLFSTVSFPKGCFYLLLFRPLIDFNLLSC
ncbi:uncharacterized protein BDZ99DRAFT_276216 [Mytilinidion resinicola]|uniref:Uncharacterized protein n=1 Tax=Mytilinidion resinicola TaxID=574789 RepID=A0A6A6YTY6_9PEZI|nr:uncharacterized protein BDZ99DRAFT_276216 [Mytilinidion resinicola]KAF2811484.1 hypothetical protein BDZ99DRAFT_276216 [Mytilinidion resinicola]